MIPEELADWIVFETDNWHLKPDAPESVIRLFNEWMAEHNQRGVDVD